MRQGAGPARILVAPDTIPRNLPNDVVEMQAAAIKPNRLTSGAVVVMPANYGRAGGPDPTGGWRDSPRMDPYGPTNFDPYNPTYIKTPKTPSVPGGGTQPSPGYLLAQQNSPKNSPIGPVLGPAPSATASLASIVRETVSMLP